MGAVRSAVILNDLGIRTSPGYYALHRETGAPVWDLRTPEEKDRNWHLERYGGLIACGRDDVAEADPETGRTIRTLTLPDPPFQRVWANDRTVVLGRGGTLDFDPVRAYDWATGKLLWSRRLNDELSAQSRWAGPKWLGFVALAGTDGRVILVAGHSVFALTLREGNLLWKRDFDVAASRAPVSHAGRVYFLAFALDGEPWDEVRFVCLDELTGETVYERPLAGYAPDLARRIQSRPGRIHDGFIVFTVQHRGRLLMFDMATGDLAWSFKYKGEIYQPSFSERGLIAGADDGNLLIFEHAPG